ncbi:amino acid ABC transporter ATP-binding protein [Luteipulveratus flavus]|uniref:Amino acid ABC transporter ATP-binding protein n=1 Tax=Luteipulveratus flavus TaxID=3031728 RepID=A0ABT6C854_9MICO|nr:amino acid ABC transporter ATP-binding protein [Luteipulveratus sp. YIM 133296]MDF8264891.1 amino acid ABC transporter ATP-binding protein [Luteipulveratus sp. YIM 133296]
MSEQIQDSTRELVDVEHLAKSFGEHEVLTDVSFTIERGGVTTIIGPSGSGKTTLLRSLNALEIADTGVVRIGDVTVDFEQVKPDRHGHLKKSVRQQLARLRAQSGMVFQSHNLFPHKTVVQNLIEGPVVVQRVPVSEARSEATRLLEQVGLAEHADKYPYQLSGGQQQRVGIARALALKPSLVLFDEPTSALDPELVGDVLAVIKDLAAAGWTMAIVTHEVRFAQQVSSQVLFIDGGLIVERGGPEVIAEPQQERTRKFLKRILDPV